MEIVGQIIGLVAMALNILSVQFKKPQHLFICRMVSSLLWALNFLLLGSPTGAIINLVNIVRSIFLLREKTSTNPFLYITIALYTVTGLLTMDYQLSILLLVDLLIIVGQVADSIGMWTKNLRYIRRCQLFAISPIWLIHNILVFSIGGIITETFTMISTLIAMYRYRDKAVNA